MSVLARASPETLRALRAIRESLAVYVQRRGDRFVARYRTGWIAFRSATANRVFAEVRPGKRGIELFLLPPRAALRDSHGLGSAVPASRGWGWFRTRVKIENGHATDPAVDLLRQSYEYARRMPRGRGRRSGQV